MTVKEGLALFPDAKSFIFLFSDGVRIRSSRRKISRMREIDDEALYNCNITALSFYIKTKELKVILDCSAPWKG